MAKQHGDYPCAPPERVAQLLSLGVGYEGYIEFGVNEKIFISFCELHNHAEITARPHDNKVYGVTNKGTIIELGFSEINTILGFGTESIKPLISSVDTYRLYKSYNSNWVDISYKRYQPTAKTNHGWRGNGKTKIFKVSKIGKAGKILGRAFFVVGVGSEIVDMIQGGQSKTKMTVDIVFAAASFIPIVGWAISLVYFVGDTFVPGGWRRIAQEQYKLYMNNVDPETGINMAPWNSMGFK